MLESEELNGIKTHTTETLSIDGNNTTSNYDNSCTQGEIFIPDVWIIICEFVLAVVACFVNMIIVCIFVRRDNRTPSTILLSALAVADSLTGLFAVTPVFVGYVFYYAELKPDDSIWGGWFWPHMYPTCKVMLITFRFAYACHAISVTITVMLCLQKCLSLQYPIWTRLHLRIKQTMIIIALIVLLHLVYAICITVISTGHFYEGVGNVCCVTDEQFSRVVNISIDVFELTCITLLIVFSIYLYLKLLHIGKDIPSTNSKIAQRKRHRSATIILIICILFILTEIVNLLNSLNTIFFSYIESIEKFYDSFFLLSWEIGFNVNFFIYLLMSKQLRKTLMQKLSLSKI